MNPWPVIFLSVSYYQCNLWLIVFVLLLRVLRAFVVRVLCFLFLLCAYMPLPLYAFLKS